MTFRGSRPGTEWKTPLRVGHLVAADGETSTLPWGSLSGDDPHDQLVLDFTPHLAAAPERLLIEFRATAAQPSPSKEDQGARTTLVLQDQQTIVVTLRSGETLVITPYLIRSARDQEHLLRCKQAEAGRAKRQADGKR